MSHSEPSKNTLVHRLHRNCLSHQRAFECSTLLLASYHSCRRAIFSEEDIWYSRSWGGVSESCGFTYAHNLKSWRITTVQCKCQLHVTIQSYYCTPVVSYHVPVCSYAKWRAIDSLILWPVYLFEGPSCVTILRMYLHAMHRYAKHRLVG